MFVHVILPIWAAIYLGLVLVIFAASFFTRYKRSFYETSGTTLSVLSICVLVFAFFNAQFASFLGWFVFPITGMGLYWEYVRAQKEIVFARARLAQEIELDDEEREFLLNVAIGLNALVVMPGYVAGIRVCFGILGASLAGL